MFLLGALFVAVIEKGDINRSVQNQEEENSLLSPRHQYPQKV